MLVAMMGARLHPLAVSVKHEPEAWAVGKNDVCHAALPSEVCTVVFTVSLLLSVQTAASGQVTRRACTLMAATATAVSGDRCKAS